jgi:arylsulfatase A
VTGLEGAARPGDVTRIEEFEDGRLELFDLAHDIGERKNLAGRMVDQVGELHAQLTSWRARVGAAMPTANPDFDPARAGEWSAYPKAWWE